MITCSISRSASTVLVFASVNAYSAEVEDPSFTEPVTFQRALDLAVERDPELKLYDFGAEASTGQIEQASLRPNPVLGAEVENFLGTGPLSGVEGLEFTLGVSQLIETARKREKRTELARREHALIDWDREARRIELEAEVRQAFITVLIAQEELSLRRELLALAERSEEETGRIVEAARSPKVELTRARLAAQRQRFSVQRAQGSLKTAKAELASLWGLGPFQEFTVLGQLRIEDAVAPLAELIALLPHTSPLARFEAESRLRDAVVDLEKARAKPDFELYAAGRYLNEEDGGFGFVAGVEFPWPLSNRNQGNIWTARAQRLAVEQEREAVNRDLLSNLISAHRVLQEAHAATKSITSELLPAAEQTLRDVEEGYQSGLFTLLTLLESRRALFEIREAYLDALSRYARAQAQIAVLTRISSIVPPNQ